MKKIGMIGGLGPEATLEYYRIITHLYDERTRGGRYPYMVIYSVNLRDFIVMMESKQWDKAVEWLTAGVEVLQSAGADFAFISANTPHIVFEEVAGRVRIPMLSIIEETLSVAAGMKLSRIGLLGTKFTMQSDFYQKVFSRQGIEVVVPGAEDQNYIHEKLMEEICRGNIVEQTRRGLLSIIERLVGSRSIDGLVLGCTELPLILDEDAYGIPFLNTTRIHAESVVRYSMEG